MTTPLYDSLSANYDRFVDWPARLSHELPFLIAQLERASARRVLDVSCGTGQHVLALARRGYAVTGADISAGMVAQAQENAAEAGLDVRFVIAGFGELTAKLGGGFDALLCLGNSLPHAETPEALRLALADFAAVLRPGGLLVIQNRNFDAVMARRSRWMPPQPHHEDGQEWLFVRFYDFNPDGTLTFHVLTLWRTGGSEWTQHTESTRLRPLLRDELAPAVETAGFEDVMCCGSMDGAPFDPDNSSDLIVLARRSDSTMISGVDPLIRKDRYG